jgi:peptide/nickel transport system substrate-binding protein
VLPADVLDEDPVPLIGSGPYRLESWKPGEELALARNPHYRGPTPAFERARRIVVPDDAERVRWVLEGRAVVADQVPLGAIPELEARSDVRVISQPGLRVLFLNLRVDRPPLDDPRVREAIDLALDREEIVARVYEGRTVPASQIVPPAVVGHAPSLAPTLPDRHRARQLLAEAGYAEGLELRLDGPNNRYVRDEPLLHEVARQLEEVGIHVTVNAQPKQDFFALQEARQSSFFLLGWACESGDAGDALDAIAHSPVEGFLGSDNGVGLQDAALDRLIDASNASSNNLERTRLMQQAMSRLASIRAFLPLVVQPETVLLSNRVTWTAPLTFAIQPEDLRPVP